MTINTLAYSRDMERVGFAPEQARGMAEALDKALSADPVGQGPLGPELRPPW